MPRLPAAPDPDLNGAPLQVFHDPVPAGDLVAGRLYDLAGREAGVAYATGGEPLVFATSRLASGVYFVEVELRPSGSPGTLARKVLKVAVVR